MSNLLHAVEVGDPELDQIAKRCNDAYDRSCAIHQALQNCSDGEQKKVLRQKHRDVWAEHKKASDEYRNARYDRGDFSLPVPEGSNE